MIEGTRKGQALIEYVAVLLIIIIIAIAGFSSFVPKVQEEAVNLFRYAHARMAE